jgi:hypothetical protein
LGRGAPGPDQELVDDMADAGIAADYREFAYREARDASPLYERLARGVAEDRDLLAMLAALPPERRQPNLLLAAARLVTGTASGYPAFRDAVLARREEVVAVMLTRRTQTNEPARCTGLYPVLARLPQPLALLEVGASAGLCLLPDRYRYDYDGVAAGAPDSPLLLRCRVDGGPPPEPAEVRVVWRAGIDLNPLDVTDPEDVRWLETLVWPGQEHRLHRLRTAVSIARAAPPRLVRGDLNDHLPGLAAQAPAGATLAVFHTAVLYQLPADARARFVGQVRTLRGHWVSQEAPDVLPGTAAIPPGDRARYALALDGQPLALTAAHGGVLTWLGRQ